MAGFPLRTLLVLFGLWCASALAAPDAVSDALAAALQAPVVNCGAARLDQQRLAPYYAAAETAPLWVSARAQLLRTVLQNAGQEGLSPARYWVADIESHWSATTPAAQACLDLLLTAGFDRYSRDVRHGLTGPHEADPSWQLRPAPFDPVAALQAAGTDSDLARLLETLPPAHSAYARLRTALARYQRLAEQGGWPPLPAGPKLAPGDEHEQVVLLRARLRSEGDLPLFALSFGTRYDSRLAAAVENYQPRPDCRWHRRHAHPWRAQRAGRGARCAAASRHGAAAVAAARFW
jgi:L,D-transpeptidase YcbB